MKRLVTILAMSALAAPATADVPVIDRTNYAVARRTAETTDRLLDVNKDILETTERTLEAVTGERSGEAGLLKGLGISGGFSVSSVPGFDSLLRDGKPDLGSLRPEVAKAAIEIINRFKLVSSLSGKRNSALASDHSYEELVRTVLGVSALITGSRQAVATRKSALEDAGQGIGTAKDVKGSIDQNTQLQVQTGLTLNEMIGVMNGAVQSLHAENQRRLTDISNTRKALTYE